MWLDSSSSRLALYILGIGIILTFLFRLILTSQYLLIGDDAGNYLSTLNYLQGNDLSGNGHFRPPLVGYFIWPFTALFGAVSGVKIAALVSSVIGAGAFYLVSKRLVDPVLAAFSSIGFIWLPIYAETLAWGFLTILVISTALLTLWSWLRYTENPGLDRALAAAGITSIMAYLNQTAVPVTAVIFGLMLTAVFLSDVRQHSRLLIPAGLLILVLTVSSIPFSQAHLVNMQDDPVGMAIRLKDPVTSIVAIIGVVTFAYAGRKIGSWPGMFIAIGGIVTSISQAVTVPSSLELITVFGRTILWFWAFAALLAVWGIPRAIGKLVSGISPAQKKFITGFAAVAGGLFLVMSWTLRFESVMPYYTTLGPDTLTALEWVSENTRDTEPVAVYPLPLAFHVNGIANRKVITTAPDGGNTSEVSYEDAVRGELARDDRAVRCSLGFITPCDLYASHLGARYLLTKEVVELPVAYSSGETKVYRLLQ